MGTRLFGVLALIAASVLVLVSDLRPTRSSDGAEVIAGPYSYLLASSTDLGPSRDRNVQLTVALRDTARPQAMFDWADGQNLAVRWHPGDNWAVLEGAADKLAAAFDVEVHDYRGLRGQVFYASPQQPAVPDALRGEVDEFGRILGYMPHHTSWSPVT